MCYRKFWKGVWTRAGSGKSTLLRMMLRQHDPEAGGGWVALNGRDARLLRRESLCAAVAAIPQQVSLVNGTIADNIAFGWCVPRLHQRVPLTRGTEGGREGERSCLRLRLRLRLCHSSAPDLC